MNKKEYVASLRELADFVESKDFPDQITGYWDDLSDNFSPPDLSFWTTKKNDFGKICSAMGSYKKESDLYTTAAFLKLSTGAKIRVSSSRENICKKVVIGTRTLAAEPETIIPAKPEREEEIVEWQCPESFVALKDEEEEPSNV